MLCRFPSFYLIPANYLPINGMLVNFILFSCMSEWSVRPRTCCFPGFRTSFVGMCKVTLDKESSSRKVCYCTGPHKHRKNASIYPCLKWDKMDSTVSPRAPSLSPLNLYHIALSIYNPRCLVLPYSLLRYLMTSLRKPL